MTEQELHAVQPTAQDVPQAQEAPLRYAGFWVRWAAAILDGWITGIAVSVFTAPLGFIMGFFAAASGDDHALVPIMMIVGVGIVSVGIVFAYYVFMTHRFGATLGKMAVGVRVCAEDGASLSLGKITLRETIGKFVSSIILNIGFLMAAFTERKRALHDMMAQSVVVYKNPVKGPNTPVVAAVYGIFALCILAVITLITIALISGALLFSNMHEDGWGSEEFFDAVKEEWYDDAVYDGDAIMDGEVFTEQVLPLQDDRAVTEAR